MDILVDLIKELTKDDSMMWVIGGGAVVSENHSMGIKEPEITPKWITIEAENWHFHLESAIVDGIQFVEAKSHGDIKSYYVRFSRNWDETLVRCYFPNPYLDEHEQRSDFQPEKLETFQLMKDKYVGKEGIVFVER